MVIVTFGQGSKEFERMKRKLIELPSPITITVHYGGKLKEITKANFEPMVISDNLPFLLLLKMIFDTYPEIPNRYPPGTIGIAVNDLPPTEFQIVLDGDVIVLSALSRLTH